MARVSGGRSSLNPNAPLFIPAVMRQVEDFSPEWWNLITTSTWFPEYWLSLQQEEDIFGDGNDVVGMLPDTIDIGVDDEILNMEAQYEEFLQSSESHHSFGSNPAMGIFANGNTETLTKNPREGVPLSPKPAMKC